VSTVALIGPDGTGKTTIAEALVASNTIPMKLLYMGMSVESSNVALPTSRLIHWLKVQSFKRTLRQSGSTVPEDVNLHGLEHRVDRRGKLGAVGRLVRRVSEEIFRQVVSWAYQRRGFLVVYDRHFVFDALPRPSRLRAPRRLTDRIHNWFLYRVYPRPDLVVLLDAEPEVLYTRKQEVPPWYLERDRKAYREKCAYAGDWLEVDVSQPLDAVIDVITEAISVRRPAEVA
jgi:thymidylate kinase